MPKLTKPVAKRKDTALNRVFKKISVRELARLLDISPQAVSRWPRVPQSRVRTVAFITGIPPNELRPDIFADMETTDKEIERIKAKLKIGD